MKIEVFSPTIRRKEMDAVLTALVEGKIGPGEQAKILIQNFKERTRCDHCLPLRSPALALYLALKSLDLNKGQGVLISALSPLYYLKVISDLDLIPIYCDVASSTAMLNRETVENAIASNSGSPPGCIILHHSLGFLSDGPGISELGIPLIEDWSKSYGSASPDAPIETSGFLTIIGLEERDMLTSGGGALLYSAKHRNAGSSDAVNKVFHGNYQQNLVPEYGLPDMNAALALVQIKELSKHLSKRKEIAQVYTQSALRTKHKLIVHSDEYNNYAFPLILEKGMKDVKTYARRKDISIESAFENTLIGAGLIPPEQCPEAYSLSLRTVVFPIYPRLGMTDAGKIAKLIQALP
ncbi:MAG: DegT/DnrJ/EryC1/StrS family aminotransferase [Treponema sp.]|nr:DegT/DnrJ/EryC1/StrS family aminotransferase [Treponema sp.]